MFIYFRVRNYLYALWFKAVFSHFFRRYGRGTKVVFPAGLEGIGDIALGDGVYIAPRTLLAAVPHTGKGGCSLDIGDGCSIGYANHIYATQRISIGREVLTANNVYISDNMHVYTDVTRSVLRQPVRQLAPVQIGDGAWLGQNACIIGASVGRHSVVGANSVVTSDIPDFCVVAGSPAVIIRRLDPETGTWRRTTPEGDFVSAPVTTAR
jgi:carbonic anhydrase/acetyltransferase-like protein (isoleucine patch superfamily)